MKYISLMALPLILSIGFLVPRAAAQSDKYSKMAPVEQYLMERNAEILLARSAAPDSISSEATILVLGRQGYGTAVEGKNGFVCMVERSWMEAFDSPEFCDPKARISVIGSEQPTPVVIRPSWRWSWTAAHEWLLQIVSQHVQCIRRVPAWDL